MSPRDGETVSSPVKVVFGIEGMTLAPAGEKNDTPVTTICWSTPTWPTPTVPVPADATHIHFGKAQTEASVELAAGKHTLQLVLGDYLHIPFDPVIASGKITVEVK